jgi:hypothetical protein
MAEKRKYQRYVVEGMGIFAKTLLNTEVEILDISINGGSVRGTKRFTIGGEYTFKFEHRDKTISTKGIIVWESLTDSEKLAKGETIPIYTAGITFRDVLTDKGKQLKEFIAEKMQEIKEIRLSGVRIKVHPPEKARLCSLETCVVKEISLGGMRVETEREPSVEELFTLELLLPEHGDSIHCKGRVAFYHETSGETAKRYTAGVEFLEIIDEGRLSLMRFVDSLP